MIVGIRVLTSGGIVDRGVVIRFNTNGIVYDTISIDLRLLGALSNIQSFTTTQVNLGGQLVSPVYPVPPHCL